VEYALNARKKKKYKTPYSITWRVLKMMKFMINSSDIPIRCLDEREKIKIMSTIGGSQ